MKKAIILSGMAAGFCIGAALLTAYSPVKSDYALAKLSYEAERFVSRSKATKAKLRAAGQVLAQTMRDFAYNKTFANDIIPISKVYQKEFE